MSELNHLGQQSQKAVEKIDRIPWEGGCNTVVTLNCSEFTSHCPVTRQPDFGVLVISYIPSSHLIETKSLKLYLWQFRDKAQFNERLVDHICTELFNQVGAHWMRVVGTFNTRGGISVTCKAELGDQDV